MMSFKNNIKDEKRLELLLRKRENEKKRLAKIKSDPITAAQLKEKEHLKYLKKKEKGKIKSITELSIREQRKQRRLWRINQRRRRAKNKIKSEGSLISTPDKNKILEHPWSSTIIKLEQHEPLTNTEAQPLTNTNIFEHPQFLTSIKLEKPEPSESTKLLEQPENLTNSRFYISSQDVSQPVPLASIKLEQPELLKSTKVLETTQSSTNVMMKEPLPSTSTKILEQLQPSTQNRFYIRSKDELQPTPSTITNVFCKPQSSAFTKRFDQSQFSTCNKILKHPQSLTNANIVGKLQLSPNLNIFGKLQPLSNSNMFDQLHPFTRTNVPGHSQPSSSTNIFGIPPTKNTTIFAKPQQITKNRFYIRTKDEKL